MPSTRPVTARPRPRSRPARPPAPTRRRPPLRAASRLPRGRRRASRSPGRPRPTTSVWPATTSTVPARRSAPRPATAYTFTGLTCGTNYTLAVDAYDAAGNHSDPGDHRDRHQRLPRHHARPRRRQGWRRARRPDLADAVVDGVERQRRRHRLSAVPERHSGGDVVRHQLHVQQSRVRNELYAGGGCG